MNEPMYIVDPNNFKGYPSGYIPANSHYIEYTNLSFIEYRDRYGDKLIACTEDEYERVYFTPYYQSLQKPWEQISEERFSDMFNIMPLVKWRTIGNYETFYACEALIKDLYSIFARNHTTNECWEALRPISTSKETLYKELGYLKV